MDETMQLLKALEAEGCITFEDDDTFSMNDEVFSTLHPALYEEFLQAHLEDIETHMLGLVEKGFIQFGGVDENGEFLYELTNMGKAYVEKMIDVSSE